MFYWLRSRPFGQQILIIAMICDPIGFAAGYLLAPSLGLEPIMGGVYGLVAASVPLSFWLMTQNN
ncbi:hypothetical protein HALLA_17370 [Halostagnicola larsenii XH-48]|uniref:DUF8141 domain-containing protein n=1 Tax=Halostagnicola larsenii XH-48 TaxID=797299 RepID=W0JSQ8_9EURY|nr:hypothetical protein [Halostagnicola larsenii]AHG00307.1 hypothetical protein HALLA_17370 [Halostagnicola larsenii XH-48]